MFSKNNERAALFKANHASVITVGDLSYQVLRQVFRTLPLVNFLKANPDVNVVCFSSLTIPSEEFRTPDEKKKSLRK